MNIFIFIATLIIPITLIVFILHKIAEFRFDKLIASDRYKNSMYRFYKINGYYALKKIESKYYVDLLNNQYSWSKTSRYFDDCLGSKANVIAAFNHEVPINFEIKSLEEID